MTGFGKAVAEIGNKKYTAEIKSLNSKQLDLTVRVPAAYRNQELNLRQIVGHRLQRGKADMVVTVENQGGDTATKLNIEALRAYKRQFVEASVELAIPEPQDWYSVLLRFADAFISDSEDCVSNDEAAALEQVVNAATDALMAYRRAEGLKLEEFFAVRIGNIANLLARIEPFEAERIEKVRTRLEENLAKLNGVEVDKGRLEQEMIFYIEKLDVNEEKQRLSQHLAYFMETMNAATPGQGKKLGFISQEMGREINTLGSKSNHADMQRIVVMMKDELEQIKEQVLNVM